MLVYVWRQDATVFGIMTLYDLTSGLLTVVGHVVLVFRIVQLLERPRVRRQRLERLCAKWLVFMIFLKVEDYLVVILDILPLGKFLVLLLKLFLFLPDNSISHSIYRRLNKWTQRVQLEEYHTHWAAAGAWFCTFLVGGLLRVTCRLAGLIDSGRIEEVESRILDIIKVLEYKRTAISMRRQTPPSDANQLLNASEFNSSLLQEQAAPSGEPRAEIGSQMNRLLLTHQEGSLRAKMEVMVAGPNRAAKVRAKYAKVEVEYEPKESRLRLASRGGEEYWTLKEIRWITKNMLNIQVVFGEGGSRILRLRDANDVVRWIQPVCAHLQQTEQVTNQGHTE